MRMSAVFCGALCAVHFSAAHAQPESPIPAAPVVVTATRTASTADQTLASVTVITREEIDKLQPVDLVDLLRSRAGVEIGRNGGYGQNASLFTRGTDSNHTLVLLDGVRINPGTIGGPALQFIDPALIERVEIVRGPRSTLYGSDAIGGVVQLFTRRADTGTSARAAGGVGTYHTYEGAAGAHHRSGNWRLGLDLSAQKSRGFPSRRDSTIDRGFRNASASAYAGFDAGGIDVELSHWQARGNAEYLDFTLAPLDQDFDNAVTAATLRAPLTATWSTTLKLSRMRDELMQNQSADFLRTKRNVLDWQNDIQVSASHLWTIGALAAREQAAALSFGTAFDVSTDNNAVFVQDQWNNGPYRLLGALRYTDHDVFGGHTTGELAGGYDVGARARVHASVATGFRAPDSTDRFGFGGNPALEPETSRNIELGWRFEPVPRHVLSLAVFRNEIENLILFVDPDGFLGPIQGMNQNVERARIRGLEAAYAMVAGRWNVEASATLQDPRNLSTGKVLPRRAKRNLALRASYRREHHAIGGELLAASRRRDSDFNDAVNAGYAIVNVFGEYAPARQWAVGARVENLFDKDYELADGFNTPGRSLFVTVRYRTR